MDKTVEEFYSKNAEQGYGDDYDRQHGPRLDALVEHFKLRHLTGQRILDVGGGYGFLGKRIGLQLDGKPDASNAYAVMDGAGIDVHSRLRWGLYLKVDLDHDEYPVPSELYDMSFFLETLEHLGNPHHALVQIKKVTKKDGDIFISIPTETVWHNAPYPSLLWPRQNFEQFLGQMALPILDFWHYQPKDIGWPAYNYRCRNADWVESKMLFHKEEAKFRGVTPLQATNL
jgi:SAM-dependent methyltransferase